MTTLRQAYRPTEDYALIGDCHSASLVITDGRIERAAPSIRLSCQ